MKVVVLSCNTNSLTLFRLDMMKSFQKRGYDVVAVGDEPQEKWNDYFQSHNIKYRQIYVHRNGMNPVSDFRTFLDIKAVLEDEKPDKVFAYHAKSIVYGGLATRCLGINEFYPMVAGIGSIFVSKGLKIKLVRAILVAQYKMAMKKARAVFFQNKDDIDLFVKKKIVKREQVVLVNGSGVNLDNFIPTPLPSQITFLSVSRLIKDKGIREYLSACELVKNEFPYVRFMLVGPYDSNPSAITKEELEPYVESGVIEYFGEQKDVRPYLNQCSVFVLASYREGVPKSVLEAMASGRAIITTDAPGCRETVDDGVNGYLVSVKNAEAIAEKMIEFINDPEKISKMSKAGRQKAEIKFDVNIINKTICDIMKM